MPRPERRNPAQRGWAGPLAARAAAATAVCVAAASFPGCGAKQVRTMDLLPYLSDSPPTVQVEVKLCNVFRVVEKPYYVLFGSCWVCAIAQQAIDATRGMEERDDVLGRIQKGYVAIQMLTLVFETFDLLTKVGWFDGASVWHMYNMYVYIFVHSSVFVRSTMMSMIVWDWYEAQLLRRSVFGDLDRKGFSDWERAFVLVVILQFGSSAFIMALIVLTHVVPALLLYVWVFLLAAAWIIKIRSWLELFGIDPEGRVGRGLVMASNSFVMIAALQALITSMTRVYAGALSKGYIVPIKDDWDSRHLQTWYDCHLGQGWGAFKDQDFLNLFIR